MAGWLKLHRRLMEKPIWKNSTSDQKAILITLLMMTNYDQAEWEFRGTKYVCEPGQFVTSLDSIKSKCGKGITIQNIRTALKRFEKFGFLTNESTKQNRLITIINWGDYQSFENEPNKETNSHLTDNQQTINNQLTTSKNNKNNKNNKKENNRYTEIEGRIFLRAVSCEIRHFEKFEKYIFKFIETLGESEIMKGIEKSIGKPAAYLVEVLKDVLKTKSEQPSPIRSTPNKRQKVKLTVHQVEETKITDDELQELKIMAEKLDKGEKT